MCPRPKDPEAFRLFRTPSDETSNSADPVAFDSWMKHEANNGDLHVLFQWGYFPLKTPRLISSIIQSVTPEPLACHLGHRLAGRETALIRELQNTHKVFMEDIVRYILEGSVIVSDPRLSDAQDNTQVAAKPLLICTVAPVGSEASMVFRKGMVQLQHAYETQGCRFGIVMAGHRYKCLYVKDDKVVFVSNLFSNRYAVGGNSASTLERMQGYKDNKWWKLEDIQTDKQPGWEASGDWSTLEERLPGALISPQRNRQLFDFIKIAIKSGGVEPGEVEARFFRNDVLMWFNMEGFSPFPRFSVKRDAANLVLYKVFEEAPKEQGSPSVASTASSTEVEDVLMME